MTISKTISKDVLHRASPSPADVDTITAFFANIDCFDYRFLLLIERTGSLVLDAFVTTKTEMVQVSRKEEFFNLIVSINSVGNSKARLIDKHTAFAPASLLSVIT